MNKITRPPAPDWLAKKWEEWGKRWEKKYTKNQDSREFRWYQYQKQGYEALLKDLAEMTQNHCSFCDAYPLGRRLKQTIEHFQPKTQFPLIAYQWENLFLGCYHCQASKGEIYKPELLKPDEDDYDFDEYFDINFDTGEIIPNQSKGSKNQERAKITIQLYGFNKNGKPEDRLEELKHYEISNGQIPLVECSYRFFIERAI
jgi:uncharacterized protein (TIGR02646 family)